MPEIPITAIDRLIRKNRNIRVSLNATKELRSILESDAAEIVKLAVILMKKAKRKTLTKEDINLAKRMLTENRNY